MEGRLRRQRVLARPLNEIVLSSADRRKARDRNFVTHLALVDAPPDDIIDAVEHFLRFRIERHRIAQTGEVPVEEWKARGDRLLERWKLIARKIESTSSRTGKDLGLHIFRETTYEHKENIAGESCDELYMTAGQYHRLADEDKVWWLPGFKSHRKRTIPE
jgi:hypothetical protein